MANKIQGAGVAKASPASSCENVRRFWTYMVLCNDGSLYTGWTVDVARRLKAHNGEIPGGAKYTSGRRPVALVWCQSFASKREAQSMEYKVKHLNRKQKENLVASYGRIL